MHKVLRLTLALLTASSVAAVSTSAFAQDVPAGPERASAEALPAPSAQMPREVIEAASVYELFIEHASAIDPHFTDGEAIKSAMVTAESYQPDQLGRGVVAYAALIALQDPRFVEGVREAGAQPQQAETLVRALEADPRQVAAVSGADEAATHINTTLIEQAERLFAAGGRVKQSAYDIQHQAWSRAPVPDAADRLARAKALADKAITPTPEDVAHLFQVAAAPHDYAGAPQADPPGYTAIVQRGLTLAALTVLGRNGREELEAAGVMKDRANNDCMHMAKLNLYQCLAVAGPHYEDVFCLGEHALKETGQCLRDGAGAPSHPAAIASALPRDTYAVPVAYAAASPR